MPMRAPVDVLTDQHVLEPDARSPYLIWRELENSIQKDQGLLPGTV
jgi:hypothetical protein